MDSLLYFVNVTMAPVNNFVDNSFGAIFNFLGNNSVGSMIGGFVGGAGALVAVGALLLSAFKGDEGFKTIKQIGLLSLIPIGSLAVGQVINFTQIQEKLTAFFVVIRNLLFMWNFWLDVPLLYGLLTASLSLLGAYWVFKLVLYFNDFFNQR